MVECGHGAVAVAVGDAEFEDLCIDLTDRLLGRKRHRAAAAGLLIVQADVLDGGMHTHLGHTLDDVGGDDAALDAILRIILEVTACKRVAVRVHRGAVPTVDIHPEGLVADGDALLIRELRIPGGSDDGSADPAPADDGGAVREDAVLQLVRTVGIDRPGFVDGGNSCRGEGAARDERGELIPGELIHERHPLRIVERDALHILQRDRILAVLALHARALRPACNVFCILDPQVVVIGLDLSGEAVVIIERSRARIGGCAAVVGDVLVVDGAESLLLEGPVVVAVKQITELELQIVRVTGRPFHLERDFRAVDEVLTAQVMIRFVQQPVAGKGIVEFPFIAGLRIDVVGRCRIVVLLIVEVSRDGERRVEEFLMRVLHDLEHDIARIDLVTEMLIRVRIVVVEGSQIFCIDLDFDRLRRTCGDDRGLGVADEVDRSLLHFTREIVGSAVELDDRLARSRARISDVDRDGDVRLLVLFGQRRSADPHVLELEVGIGEAVTVRVSDRCVVPGVRRFLVRSLQELGIHGLVITIAHVDALGVVHGDVVAAVGGVTRNFGIHQHPDRAAAVARSAAALAGTVKVRRDLLAADGIVCSSVAQRIINGGIGVEIVHPEVNETAGGIRSAGEHSAERQVAVPAGRTQPKDGVKVRIVDDVGDLHDRRGLQEDDDLIELALRFLILRVCEEGFLCIRQSEVVIGDIGMSLDIVRLVVDELGTRSADRDDRGAVLFERIFNSREEVVRCIVVLVALELDSTCLIEFHVFVICGVAVLVDADPLGTDKLFRRGVDREAVILIVSEAFIDRLLRLADPVVLRCDRAVGRDTLCARTASAILHERAEDSHVPLPRCKRKCLVLILHQNKTFAGDLDVEFAARFHGVHVRIVFRFVHGLRSIKHTGVCAERAGRCKTCACEYQRGRQQTSSKPCKTTIDCFALHFTPPIEFLFIRIFSAQIMITVRLRS